ncbi:hypothetical protein QZM05_15970 [Burkholderia multivorans]|nr:hypothetical protein [Burkholderia multivorans]
MGDIFSKIRAQTPSPEPAPHADPLDMLFAKKSAEKAQRYASYLGEETPAPAGPGNIYTIRQVKELERRYNAKYEADQQAAALKAQQDAVANDPAVKAAQAAAAQAEANAAAQAAATRQAGIDAANAQVNAVNAAANGAAQRAAASGDSTAQALDGGVSVDTNANSQVSASYDPRRRFINQATASSAASVSRGGSGISIS